MLKREVRVKIPFIVWEWLVNNKIIFRMIRDCDGAYVSVIVKKEEKGIAICQAIGVSQKMQTIMCNLANVSEWLSNSITLYVVNSNFIVEFDKVIMIDYITAYGTPVKIKGIFLFQNADIK